MPSTEQYAEFFDSMDEDGSGKVTLQEMKDLLKTKGHTDSQIEGLFDTADLSCDGEITKDEFMSAMGCAPPEQMTEAAWRRAFLGFDKDRNGTINKSELKAVMEEAGREFSEDEVNRMMDMVDESGDDVITYEEFIKKFCGGDD